MISGWLLLGLDMFLNLISFMIKQQEYKVLNNKRSMANINHPEIINLMEQDILNEYCY